MDYVVPSQFCVAVAMKIPCWTSVGAATFYFNHEDGIWIEWREDSVDGSGEVTSFTGYGHPLTPEPDLGS